MLNIYYGGESYDKEKFIFDSINPEHRTIIIVPDQFSLQMERDALEYYSQKCGKTALVNLVVTDFSSLGQKVIREAGIKEPELIDKYGRHMLLSIMIQRLAEADRLSVFRNMSGFSSFTENANQIISEMKRYGVKPEDLEAASENTSSFLKLKLSDLREIFNEYEKSIEGRFLDSEDYIRFYGEIIAKSKLIGASEIWIYGFDTFSPLNIEVIQKLLEGAESVNIIMTKDETNFDARVLTVGGGERLFGLTDIVIDKLQALDENSNVYSLNNLKKRDTIWNDKPGSKISLACCTNIYAEADRVAAHIIELVREKGYRYGDITVICNDMDVRGGVLQRTFDRWGIPAFADRKRRVLHQPVVRFLLSFLDVIAGGYEGDSIMKMISTGLMGWSRDEEELLINYTSEGKIRGSKWKKEFTWTGNLGRGSKYSEEDLACLNNMRQYIVDITEGIKNEMGRRNSAAEKVQGIYNFFESKFEIRDRIQQLINRQIDLNLVEGAAETAQSWNMICGLFTQIIRIIGEDNISNVQLRDILCRGLEEMKIGLVPTSADCVIIGTLQRTRISKTRSLIVTSANEGILPLQTSDTGLLTDKELDLLEELKLEISKKEEVRRQEEQLAIYRMFSIPQDELFVTCSLADQDGKSANPSGIFNTLKEIDGSRLIGDLGNDDIMEKVVSNKGTLPYMTNAMQQYIENGKINDIWLATISWYMKNDEETMNKIHQGLSFDNKIDAIDKEVAESLYFGDRDSILVSASRLEQYSECPFRHFIQYGLKADENRKFEIDGRSRGDIYHKALQILSKRLMPPEGMSVNDDSSDWMTISEENCRKQIDEILRKETADYGEGVFVEGGENQLQLKRIIENCGDIAWAMIGQVRQGNTKKMFFEEPFGFNCRLKPMEIQLQGGKSAILIGKIDRIDVMDVSNNIYGEDKKRQAIRVIDYKTGDNKVDKAQIEEGYRLQLMVYMNTVFLQDDNAKNTLAEPAGVFYFKIKDIDFNADIDGTPKEKGDTVEERIAKACKLEGILVDDERIIKSMDQTLENGISSIAVPVRKLKSGELKKNGEGELISVAEFKELCDKTSEHVKRICHEIQEGHIDIAPKQEKKTSPTGESRTSCTYCQYKSICLFDTSFRQCRYEMV